MSDDARFTDGSGNIYADLGFANPEEEQSKARLARRIAELIKERGLSQAAAADLLGIDQPKVSALQRGRLGGFSLERLMRFLTRLDQDIEITVRPKAPSSHQGRIAVSSTPSEVATAASATRT